MDTNTDIKNIQNKLLDHFDKTKNKTYTGEAGGGIVKVTVRADLLITDVEIDHMAFEKTAPAIIDDLDFLADLFKAAANQAVEKSNKDLAENALSMSF